MSKRLTQEEVEKIFSDGGCIFDDIYINTYTPHIYTCKCGNKSKISIDNFKSGSNFNRALTNDDLPAPDGAETNNRLPEVIGFVLIAPR